MSDLKYAFRSLAKSRGFTAVAVVTLAIGIAANVVIFSVVNAVLFAWVETYRDPDKLVLLFQTRGDQLYAPTPADYRDWTERARLFESIEAYHSDSFTLESGAQAERVLGGIVSAGMFRTLGVQPLLGRSFAAREDEWGRHRVVVLSYGLWRRRFGGDRAIVGRRVTLNEAPHEVVGVMPPGAWFSAARVDLWVPLAFAPKDPSNARNNHFLRVLGRIRPDATLDRANAEMAAIATDLERLHPANKGMSARGEPLRRMVLGDLETQLTILTAAVAFVLLIGCANVANLLLTRAAARQREIAIRSALGANRRRLVGQLLTESAVLAVCGGAAGLALAYWTLDIVGPLLPFDLPRVHETDIAVSGRVVAFAVAASVLTTLLFGLVPALQTSRLAPGAALVERGAGETGGRRGRWLRSSLAIAQLAIALVLLSVAGVLIRSFIQLQRVDLGVRGETLLTVHLPIPREIQQDAAKSRAVLSQIVDRARTTPGVERLDTTSALPLGGGGQSKFFTIIGQPAPTSLDDVPQISARQEGPEALQTMGARLLKGRFFDARDRTGNTPVAIIERSTAERFFAGQDPIGRVVMLDPPESLAPPTYRPAFTRWTIVGVVDDIRYRDPSLPAEFVVHVPYLQREQNTGMGWSPTFLVARTSGDPADVVTALTARIREAAPYLPVSEVRTLEDIGRRVLSQPRFLTAALGVFAAVALTLAAIGLYGVLAYGVAQRTREFGIRLALGARRNHVIGLVLRQAAVMGAIGAGLGILGSLAATRVARGLLFDVGPSDPATFAAVLLLLATVALVASYVPARRATRVDPMMALRSE